DEAGGEADGGDVGRLPRPDLARPGGAPQPGAELLHPRHEKLRPQVELSDPGRPAADCGCVYADRERLGMIAARQRRAPERCQALMSRGMTLQRWLCASRNGSPQVALGVTSREPSVAVLGVGAAVWEMEAFWWRSALPR